MNESVKSDLNNEAATVARENLDRIVQDARRTITSALPALELTGDHDHGDGRGSLRPGVECGPGKDCTVRHTRQLLKAFDSYGKD